MAPDDRQLLQRFLASGSSDDFAPIVDQYLNLVYSTARKMSSIDGGQLEDICQTVFADLVRKAGQISEQTPLSGWLYRHTCFVASNHNRSERRRRERERQALEMSESKSAPDVPNEELHLAMTELPDQDRDALVLRFMDEWDLRRVGERLGISEDAAQKRVSRALDKLRSILGRKGITASTATLAICLGQQVAAAPLAAKSVAVAAVGASASAGFIPAMIEFMNAPLAKLAAVVVIGGGVAASMHHQNQQLSTLRKQNTELAAKVSRMAELEAENQRQTRQGLGPDELAALRKKADEVHALRAEMGKLRQQMRESTASASVPSPTTPPANEPPAEEAAPVETQFLFTTKIIGRGDDFPGAKVPEILRTIAGGPGSAAVFPSETLPHVIKAFTDTPGFDVFSAPRVISMDGRQAQVQVGQAETIITGFHTQADGTRLDETRTNIHTGVTVDITGTKQADNTLVNLNFNLTTFDGYLDEGRGINKKAVSQDVWYHETAPIVDIANTQVAVLVGPNQTMLLHAKSKPGNKDYWIFLTPKLLDKSTVNSVQAQAQFSPTIASSLESKIQATPAPRAP